MKTFTTMVDKLGVVAGTRVTHDEAKDNVGKTGKLLCTIPDRGSLFYAKDELKEA